MIEPGAIEFGFDGRKGWEVEKTGLGFWDHGSTGAVTVVVVVVLSSPRSAVGWGCDERGLRYDERFAREVSRKCNVRLSRSSGSEGHDAGDES